MFVILLLIFHHTFGSITAKSKLSLNQIIINRTFAANEENCRLQKAFERR